MKKYYCIIILLLIPIQSFSQWKEERTNRGEAFLSSFFQDSTTGLAAGSHDAILRTTNGGSNWSLSPILSKNNTIHSVYFVDKLHGWAVTYAYTPYRQGGIIYTSDGGSSWIDQYSIDGTVLHSIYFVDTTTGWAVGSNGLVLNTTDGGQNWSRQIITPY